MTIKSGFLFVWKPKGWTSFDVIRKFKGQIKAYINDPLNKSIKIGHSGVLDPMAEGLLLVGFGQATKFFQFVPDRKTYLATGVLGKASDTYDKEGKIIDAPIPDKWPNEEYAHKILSEKFLGKILQTPPIFSNIKVNGIESRRLARQGETVESINLQPRPRIIFSITLIEWDPPYFKIKLDCESGTYVRSLIHDFGIALKSGAYCDSIIRTKIGPFSENKIKIARLNTEKSEFEITDNIISIDELFMQSIFQPIILTEFWGDEILLKSRIQIDIPNIHTGEYPIFAGNKFIGFAVYNNDSKNIIAKRLVEKS